MTKIDAYQIIFYLVVLVLTVVPLGSYMARVYLQKPCGLDRVFGVVERFFYRFCRINVDQEMNWKVYLSAVLLFNLSGLLLVYVILRLQYYLPFNPQHVDNIDPFLAYNTAISFVTNTDWQAYSGETVMSYFSQMLAFTVQNFLSAATGMSLVVALIRGLVRTGTTGLGNFWVDMVRTTLYILLPLSLIFAVFLSANGVIQTMKPYQTVQLIEPLHYNHSIITEQTLPMGPVASQTAIMQLGSNGGGFFNTNAAHPFENPTPLTNFFEMLAILLIPAALCYTFGVMVGDRRQGIAILMAMLILFLPAVFVSTVVESDGNPAFASLGIASNSNMEGKETRFGIVNSTLWATATTATSNGSVNSMHDSFTPLGGMMPLWLMHLGEVAFGGVGSGLYGMLMLVIITVFVAGLMVGRTPEYLGKKIEPYEMKMATLAVLIVPLAILIFTAIAAVTNAGVSALGNPGAHGLTEILYASTSMGNNDGSAFAGLNADTPFYTLLGGIIMMLGRYWIAIPMLALAGSLAKKKLSPSGLGTLSTHTVLFIVMLVSITIIIASLSYLPALALGPIVEQLLMWGQYGR